jgi:hypothetical protein
MIPYVFPMTPTNATQHRQRRALILRQQRLLHQLSTTCHHQRISDSLTTPTHEDATRCRARRTLILKLQRLKQFQCSTSSVDGRSQSDDKGYWKRRRLTRIQSQGLDTVRAEETIQRQRRRKNQTETQQQLDWWDSFATCKPNTRLDSWLAPCPHCGVQLLSSEAKTFCCNGGKRILPRLKPLPVSIDTIVDNDTNNIAHSSRKINNLFCLTTMGVSGNFVHFPGGVQTVSIQGMSFSFNSEKKDPDLTKDAHTIGFIRPMRKDDHFTGSSTTLKMSKTTLAKIKKFRNPS